VKNIAAIGWFNFLQIISRSRDNLATNQIQHSILESDLCFFANLNPKIS